MSSFVSPLSGHRNRVGLGFLYSYTSLENHYSMDSTIWVSCHVLASKTSKKGRSPCLPSRGHPYLKFILGPPPSVSEAEFYTARDLEADKINLERQWVHWSVIRVRPEGRLSTTFHVHRIFFHRIFFHRICKISL